MILRFLTSFFRMLRKNITNSVVHILGLSLGIGAALVLFLFSLHELSYDKFHVNKDHIYMVYKERVTPNGVQPAYDTWVPMLEQMSLDFPEIIGGSRFFNDNVVVAASNNRYDLNVGYVDSTFFNVFTFPVVFGNSETPFATQQSAVVSESTALQLYGTTDVVGKDLQIDFQNVYSISAVIRDLPRNSSIQFEIAVQLTSHPAYEQVAESWGGSFLNTYIVLNKEASVSDLETKFPGFIEKIWDEETRARTNFKLLPLLDSYDTFIGDVSDAYILMAIAAGILLIASINFMNLATASSIDRAREIAMRKVMGSNQKQLMVQFLAESILTTFVALVVGVGLALLVIPWINQLFQMQITLDLLNLSTDVQLMAFALVLGTLSGLYPAFFIARFPVINSLKGLLKAGGSGVRKVLVILQFTLSTTLIIVALVVYKQLNFMLEADLSYNKDHLIVIPVSSANFEDSDDASIRIKSLRDEINANSKVISSTTSTHIPSRWSGSNTFVAPTGWEGDPLRMRFTYHDASFFETYGIELLEGPGFLPDSAGNQRGSVVLNRSAAEAFGFEDGSDKTIQIGDRTIDVVGIIEDFNFETLRSEITPILHFHRIPANGVHNYITVRANPASMNEVIDYLEEKWAIVSDSDPMSYFFLEEQLSEMYAAEDRMLKMVGSFTVVTIFIACLGLYGLSAFMIEKRKKEMGIRKVLGASLSQIFYSVSANFATYIAVGFVVAIPLSYYLASSWLEDFAYNVPIGFDVFLVALAASLLVGLLSVSYKAVTTARTNPVKTLREE